MSNERFEKMAAKQMGYDLAEDTEITETAEVSEKTEPNTDTNPESSLKEDTTQETSEESSNVEKSFEDLLAEKTNGKIKTYEDIESLLSSKDTSSKFANEQIAQLNDYVAKGGDVQEYLKTQTANYDEMEEFDLVKSHMKFNNQDLESDEVDLLFNSKYKLDEDIYTADEIKLSKIQLRTEAKKAKKALKSFQEESSVPKQHREQVSKQKQSEESQKLWAEKIDNSLSDFKDVSFDINDKGEKFSYSLSEDAIENVRTSNKNLSDFWNRYVNEDGSENITRLNTDMATLNDLDSIVRSAFAQGLSKGKGDIIDDIKNPSYSPESKTISNKPLSMAQQIADELRKNN